MSVGDGREGAYSTCSIERKRYEDTVRHLLGGLATSVPGAGGQRIHLRSHRRHTQRRDMRHSLESSSARVGAARTGSDKASTADRVAAGKVAAAAAAETVAGTAAGAALVVRGGISSTL